MAIGSSFSEFEGGLASVQENYDDVTLQMVSVVYQNGTPKRAIVEITQGNKTDTFVVLPGAGVPTPITQAIPNNRYTYHVDLKQGGVAPDFTYQVTFKA